MKLELTDPKNILDRKFIFWLKEKIRNKVIANIDSDHLKLWDNYLNNNPVYKSIYKKRISTRDIIIAGASNLDFIKSESNVILAINCNIFTPGLDRIKLEAICKLINYGNLEMKGYPIFTNTFDYFAANIHKYIEQYVNGLF